MFQNGFKRKIAKDDTQENYLFDEEEEQQHIKKVMKI